MQKNISTSINLKKKKTLNEFTSLRTPKTLTFLVSKAGWMLFLSPIGIIAFRFPHNHKVIDCKIISHCSLLWDLHPFQIMFAQSSFLDSIDREMCVSLMCWECKFQMSSIPSFPFYSLRLRHICQVCHKCLCGSNYALLPNKEFNFSCTLYIAVSQAGQITPKCNPSLHRICPL